MDTIKKKSWKLPSKIGNNQFENVLFDEADRDLPSHLRIHCVKRLETLHVSMSFQNELSTVIESLIQEGYKGRNPYSVVNTLKFRQDNFLDAYPNEKLTAMGGTLIGSSGMGKSVAVQDALGSLTQVLQLEDESKKEVPLRQLVWINMDCTHDGSFRELCYRIVNNVDSVLQTEYANLLPKKCLTERLAVFTAKILRLHGLGILVIDEIQHLTVANEVERDEVFKFLIQLVNHVGIPVLLVGTPKAHNLIQKKFCPFVKSSSSNNLFWERMELGHDWNLLIKTLLDYQWTKEKASFSSEIVKVLYEEAVGIPWIAVKGMIFAQQRAITCGLPMITPDLIKIVIRDNLHLIQPYIEGIRNKEKYR